jgi:hypothetical protein
LGNNILSGTFNIALNMLCMWLFFIAKYQTIRAPVLAGAMKPEPAFPNSNDRSRQHGLRAVGQ